MKYLKTLGLAAVAAAALMAFVGSGTASATVLCKTNPVAGVCPAGWKYEGEIDLRSTEKPKITTTFKTIECNESRIAGTPTNFGSATETVSGPISIMTFNGSCNCPVTVVQKGNFEIHVTGDTGNGTLTFNGTTVTVSCSTIFGTVHCIYVTENDDIAPINGGADIVLSITIELKREKTDPICDEEAIWHAKYTIATPGNLWVATS